MDDKMLKGIEDLKHLLSSMAQQCMNKEDVDSLSHDLLCEIRCKLEHALKLDPDSCLSAVQKSRDCSAAMELSGRPATMRDRFVEKVDAILRSANG